MNTIPFEVIGAPLTLWAAAVGSTFPAIDVTPSSPFARIGTAGDLSYDQDGINIEMPQSMEPWRPLGDAGPRKYFRTEEDITISVMLADLTLEQLKYALNNNTVSTIAATMSSPGYRKIGLSRGLTVNTIALLCRATGYSPYGIFNLQYEFPRVVDTSSPNQNWRRTVPVTYQLQFKGVVDETAVSADERFGRLLAQEQDALT